MSALLPCRNSVWLLLCLSLSLSPAPASAAVGGSEPPPAASASGAIEGSVRTSDGLGIPALAVELRSGDAVVRLVTGPDGQFRANGLAAGDYSASVDAPGFALASQALVRIAADKVRLDLVLEPLPVRERVIVSATRNDAALSTLGVAADLLDRQRIENRAAPELLSLLQEVPGVATARAGGTGVQASAFVRGGESRYARVLIDGVPVNQPGGAYDFGTVLPFELERVEVVRGAASSLYGSDALAGVVSLTTRRAREGQAPSLRADAEGGSFDWQRFAGATSGARGAFDWNAGVQRLTTDNEQPNGAFEQTTAALSSGLRLDRTTDVRGVFRLDDSTLGTPGATGFGRPDLDASFDRQDLLGSLALRRSGPRLAQRASLSWARTQQLSLNPLDSGSYVPEWNGVVGQYEIYDFPDAAGFQNQTSRGAASYQADVALGARHLLTAGVEAERQTGAIGNRAEEDLLHPERTNVGLYLQDRVLLGSRAYLTLGGRVEYNGSYGTSAVPRAALAVRLREGDAPTTLRASAGMGVKEPSFLESYGEFTYAKGNPDLDPERSTTFDLGLEQRIWHDRLRGTATAFYHEYRDQIAYTMLDYTTFEGTYVNLARTRSQGLELSLEARPLDALHLLGHYTFQDGEILDSPSDFDPVYEEGRRLLRRPRHQGSFSVWYGSGRASLGATLVCVGERADSDFLGLGLADDASFSNPGYARLDVRARLRVTGQFEIFLAGDNVTEEQYEEVLGYPALGRALRAGVRLNLGRP